MSSPMTARDAFEVAAAARPGLRLRHFETICGPQGRCHRQALSGEIGWTWCPDCLTVYDEYGLPVNPIPEFAKTH